MTDLNVLLAVADGSEDMETVITLDVLRRAGLAVTLTSVMPQRQITCAHGTQLRADALMADVLSKSWDAIVLPGGMPGAEYLSDCTALINMLREQDKAGKTVAAICASPAVVLAKHGLLKGKQAVAYPGFEQGLAQGEAILVEQAVVQDGHVITSRGPSTAMLFALQIIKHLCGEEKATQVAKGLLLA